MVSKIPKRMLSFHLGVHGLFLIWLPAKGVCVGNDFHIRSLCDPSFCDCATMLNVLYITLILVISAEILFSHLLLIFSDFLFPQKRVLPLIVLFLFWGGWFVCIFHEYVGHDEYVGHVQLHSKALPISRNLHKSVGGLHKQAGWMYTLSSLTEKLDVSWQSSFKRGPDD